MHDHAAAYTAQGLQWPGDTHLPRVQQYLEDQPCNLDVLTDREKDLLFYALSTEMSSPPVIHGGSELDESTLDLYHSLTRARCFKHGRASCVLPHSDMWLLQSRRLLSPHEAFLLQSFDLSQWHIEPRPVPTSQGDGLTTVKGRKRPRPPCSDEYFSRSLLFDLAGNSFSGSCIGLCLLVAFSFASQPLPTLAP